MDKEYNTLYELCETVKMELEELNNKVGRNKGLTNTEAEWLKCLTESLVNIKCAIQMIEEESGMTNRGRMMSRTMANSRRDGMTNRGRNSYNNSYYSGDAKSDFMADVESLMNRAPDEHTRMKFERMLNDMR